MRLWKSAAIAALVATAASAAGLQYLTHRRLGEIQRHKAVAQRRLESLAHVERIVRPLELRHTLHRDRLDTLEALRRRPWPLWEEARRHRVHTGQTLPESSGGLNPAHDAWGERLTRITRLLAAEPSLHRLRVRHGKLAVTFNAKAAAERVAARLESAGLIESPVIRRATTEEVPQAGFVLGAHLTRPLDGEGLGS